MDTFHPFGIQVHLLTGRKHMFYQEDPQLVEAIAQNLSGQIFSRPSLIIDGRDGSMSFPGHAIVGITVVSDPLPESFLKREQASNVVVTQISAETFHIQRLRLKATLEGVQSALLSEIEFVGGERLYLEFCELGVSGLQERSALGHLFSSPSISCRRADNGFSIWNTAHIVSWSNFPKREVPSNAWPAESISWADGAGEFETIAR